MSFHDLNRAANRGTVQTGCLAIAGTEDLGGETLYRLGYPNREVRESLNERLLRAVGPDASRQEDA